MTQRSGNAVDVEEHLALDGVHGKIISRVRRPPDTTHLAVIVHGYGEHGGRYAHVAQRLAAAGATVATPDHHGHGRSDGARAVVGDAEEYVTDLHTVVRWATRTFPGLPLVLIGHSMGGLIATRYAQQHRDRLAGLALSGPVVGGAAAFAALATSGPATGWHGPFQPATLLAVMRSIDALAAGPGLGSLPTLWLHGAADPLVPLNVARAAMRGLRCDAVEERVYAGAASEILSGPNRGLADLITFVARIAGRFPGPSVPTVRIRRGLRVR